MATTASPFVRSVIIPRCTTECDWRVIDMAVRGNKLAVCGYNDMTYTQSFIDLFTLNDPDSSSPLMTQLCSKIFDHARCRCVSFLDDSRIVTILDDLVHVYHIDAGDSEPLHTVSLVHDRSAECVTVREGEILIGMPCPNKVIVFDFSLSKIKTITLEGLEKYDSPADITVYGDNLFISTSRSRAIRYNMEGKIVHEYKTPGFSSACSITVSRRLVYILWSWLHVVVYCLSDSQQLMSFIVDFTDRIRIVDVIRLLTVYRYTGEVREYSCWTYPRLIDNLTLLLSKNDCHQLAHHVALPKYQLDAIINNDSSAKDLLDILEERGVIHTSNVSRLLEAIKVLNINKRALSTLEYYQESRVSGDETSYGRFLAGLSSHLLLSLPRKLCDYFKFTNEKRKAVITSQTPGIDFLLTLEEKGVINHFDVGKLVNPLKQYQLVQAVAKVQEYQTLVDERSECKKPIHTLEGKQTLFIECLKKKTKSWYETMTPLPWKKSCKWMTSELFIACGLVLTNSKAKMKTTDVDQECKLKYTDILTHRRLKSATRIIIEGDPGSGKTMLSSQLAYDWSIGKSTDARMVVFLPLKFVDGMTIIEAIKQFYIPKGNPLNEGDIKAILDQASVENKTCIVLDGLEEYNGRTKDGEPSEVERVMRKEKFPNCTVVLASRSDFVHGLPQCPMLKLGRFGEEERDQYIANIIPDDREKQQKVKCSIETSALLFNLCSNALLFVYIVHNIEHLGQIDKPNGQLDSVGPFMEVMVNTLLSRSKSENSESAESEIISTGLSEIAFNGLCKGYQQLLWQKSFLDENVSNVKDWIESGILVVEEGETTREEKHQKKGEAVYERLLTQDEIISIDDERREGESLSEAALSGEGQDDILSSDKESPRDRESSNDNKPSETEKPFTERKTTTDLQNLSLQVKFLHKVIQEWFAAKHFSSMLQRSKGQYCHQLFLNKHLPLINPADLHYVLRFTSYLCPENCYLIIEHLHRFYKSSKGVVPEYILNCIFLCFNECKSSVGKKKMKNIVRQVCENIVTIRGEDSRLLQESKVSMLTYASISEICIATLRLVDLVVEVTKATLTFNSNITLECFPTLKVIEVSRWDLKLKKEDFKELIKFITKCKLLNKALLNFPSPPPLLTDKKLLSSMKKNLTIEWKIGERVIHTLDKKSGEWPMLDTLILMPPQMEFRSTPHQTTDQVMSKSLRVRLMINKEGGRLDIPDTGASLEIPSGALEGEQSIQMIIIPPHLESESLTFGSNSSLGVELLPSNLHLLKPAILTLPHCLVLKKGCEWKAKIYRSHHKEGSKPQWEEQYNTPNKLGEQNCVIEIQRLSWYEFEVDAQIVEAKNIIMYAAGRCVSEDTIFLDIGYYLNLATFKEVSKRNDARLLHEQPTVFKNDGNSLKILLEKFEPMNWTYSKRENRQAISFEDVAIRPWYFCTFVLNKTEPKGTDACTCYCKAGQAPHPRNFIFQLKPPDVLTLLHESLQKVFAEMTRSDCENLANFFMFPLKHVKAIINSPSHSKDLLVELENKGIVQSALTDELCENLGALNILTGSSNRNYFSSPSSAYLNPNTAVEEEDWKPPDTMEITSSISGKGGLLQIPNTGIKLVFPPNAVTEEHNIQVKIVPPSLLKEPATSFSSNSSVVLELLPNGLHLKHEVSLTLPHCLTFFNEEKAKAKVYVSHHEEGQRPRWEERPLSPYIFHRSKCTVRLLDFCWFKIEIDNKEVEAKKIVVFATKDILQDKKTANLEVGYYDDIPERGEPNVLELNPNMKPEKKRKFKFLKEGKQPLTISFNGTNPGNTWDIVQEGEKTKEISWQSIAKSDDCFVSFQLYRKQTQDSFCNVSAQQGNSDPMEFVLKLEVDQSTVEILDRKVPDRILKNLATKLAGEWKMLARWLDISEADLHNIEANNFRRMEDTKYFMLHHWRERNGAGATYRVLATALDKTDLINLKQYVESQATTQGRNEPMQVSTYQHGWFRGWLNWFKWW